MITIPKSSNTPVQLQELDDSEMQNSQRVRFFQSLLENLQDGLLLLNETGEVLYANPSAHRIFSQFNQDSFNSDFIPPAIDRLCKSLLESRSLFTDKVNILSNDLIVDKSKIFRVRAKRLNVERFNCSYLLLIIEDKYESLKNVALAEVKKYELTPREAEIWCLYRAKFSYKEIAAQLYITVNTVKKHMKNIHAKRQAFLNTEE